MILGVCEWLSVKLDIQVSALRIAFIIAVLVFGAGIGFYLILWVVKILSK